MGIAKITRNFQITLPKDVREMKKLKEGDKIIFSVKDDHVEIVKLDKNVINDAAGLWPNIKETGLEYERRVRNNWKTRLKR